MSIPCLSHVYPSHFPHRHRCDLIALNQVGPLPPVAHVNGADPKALEPGFGVRKKRSVTALKRDLGSPSWTVECLGLGKSFLWIGPMMSYAFVEILS